MKFVATFLSDMNHSSIEFFNIDLKKNRLLSIICHQSQLSSSQFFDFSSKSNRRTKCILGISTPLFKTENRRFLAAF